MTRDELDFWNDNGYLIVKNFLKQQEVDLLRGALETDQSLRDQQIQLNDQNEGQTKFALWSNPGDGTLGMLTRSRRVVETCEQMLGGPVLHYHSKNLVKYPEEGGVWNWHQECAPERLALILALSTCCACCCCCRRRHRLCAWPACATRPPQSSATRNRPTLENCSAAEMLSQLLVLAQLRLLV